MTRKILLSFFLAFFLPACAMLSAHQGQQVAELTYEHIAPVKIQVISVQQPADFIAPFGAQDMANDFIIPPAEALHDYFKRKLVPAGAANNFVVELERASIFRQYVPSPERWKSMFQLGARYDYALALKFKMLLRNSEGRLLSGKRLVFKKQFSIPTSESIAVREARQMEVIEGLVKDIDLAVSSYLLEAKLLNRP